MSIRTLISALWVGVCLVLATPVGGLAQQTAPAHQATAPAAGAQADSPAQSYVLGPEDVIEADILGRSDFRTRAEIGPDGKIQLPYLGTVEAANRTVLALTAQVRKALEAGGFFSNPNLKIEIVSYHSRYVIVLGEVRSPGLVPVDRAYRLSEILARVGSVSGAGADYVILRSENGPERRLSVKDLATGDSTQDPYVSPGDKVYVPHADVFYISGQVRTPGTFSVEPNMTVRIAIARGGGLTELGSEGKVKITRHGVKVAKVDLESKIEPDDVIIVGERLF